MKYYRQNSIPDNESILPMLYYTSRDTNINNKIFTIGWNLYNYFKKLKCNQYLSQRLTTAI